MSYNDKITSVRELLEAHNKNASKTVPIDKFFKALEDLGGGTEEALMEATWEDIQDCGTPKILSRQIAAIFRVRASENWVNDDEASKMNPNQLLASYDPKFPNNPVANALNKFAKKQAFLVFMEGNMIDTVATQKLFDELLGGHKERQFYQNGNVRTRVYAIGDGPDQHSDVNPLYPNGVLRPDGSCDITGRSWDIVEVATRQLIYLARTKTKEIVINSNKDAIGVLDDAATDDAFNKISEYCPVAALMYSDLSDVGELPSLRIARNGSRAKANDPFHGSTHQKY